MSAKIDQVGSPAGCPNYLPTINSTKTDSTFSGYFASNGRSTSSHPWDIFKGSGSNTFLTTSTNAGGEVIAGDVNVIRLARLAGNIVNVYCNGVLVQTATDNTSPIGGANAGMYFDSTSYSDGSSNTPLDNFVVHSSLDEIGVQIIGASISYGYNGTQVGTGARFGSAAGRGANGLPVRVRNDAVSGTTTADVINGSNGSPSLATLVSRALTDGVRHVFIGGDLGVNDAKAASSVSVNTHTANIQAIIAAYVAAGIRVWITQGSYVNLAGSINAGGTWNAGSNTLISQYWTSDAALADGINVCLLDQSWYAFIEASPSLAPDGAHLSDAGYQTYWNRIAAIFTGSITPVLPLASVVLAPASGGPSSAGPFSDGTQVGTATLPIAPDVRQGIAFGAAGASRTGGLSVPPVGAVLAGDFTDNTVGTLVLPNSSAVLKGTAYGIGGSGSTGTLGVPAVGQVQGGVAFGASNGLTGTLFIPPVNKVIAPTAFGVANGSTGTAIMPLAAAVQQSVAFGPDANGATVGTLGASTGPTPPSVYSVAADQVNSASPINYGVTSSSAALLARIIDDTGTPIVANTVSSVMAIITDMKAGTTASAFSLGLNAVLSSLLPWAQDAIGYNFKAKIDASNFPAGNTTYQIVVAIVANGSTFEIVWQLQTGTVL